MDSRSGGGGAGERPAVIVVREQLEDREIANFVPLQFMFDISLLTLRHKGPYGGTGLGLPLKLTRRVGLNAPPQLTNRLDAIIGGERDPQRLRRVQKLLTGADVVIVNETHMASSAQLSELRRSRHELRLVTVCYENIPFRYEDSARLTRRKDLVRRYTDVFIALTPQAREALIEEGVEPERIELQPYGVETRRFETADRSPEIRRRWGVTDDDVVLLFTGRLLQEKGLVELVRAATRTARSNLRLVLVGSGPESARLDRVATGLGFAQLIRQPWVSANEIPALLRSADVFALPSLPTPYWEEQLGFAAIEAMATALPILGVASGSIPFVVGDGGMLVPPYDVDALADGLTALIDSVELRNRIGRAGARRVREVLNTDTVAAGLGSIIERALRT